jgi:bifunctional enzyme CysN/CysC
MDHPQHSTELLRFCTAGSVDDGKSTLIGRLLYETDSVYEDHLHAVGEASKKLSRDTDLALLTDGLKAEREQGITIDVAYRYFSTPRRRFIIADTPGHEQYTRNMVTGASTADLAIILLDAKNGITTQSKRHGFIASLMGMARVVVAVNKMDLVDYAESVYDGLCREYADFAAKLDLPGLTFMPISALCGDNVVTRSERMPWYQGSALLPHLETVEISGNRNLVDFRMPIQLVNRPNPGFRGYSGSIESGVVRVGDEVLALPSGLGTKVERIFVADVESDYAYPPQAVTVCLADEIDLSRGGMLVHPGNKPQILRDIEAMLVWMDETPLDTSVNYRLKHGTAMVRTAVNKITYKVDPNTLHRADANTLATNDIGRVSLGLFQPIACESYRGNQSTGSFILVDPESNRTVACGMIIDRGADEPGVVSANITQTHSLVSADQRKQFFKQEPATLWFTGLSGSGKTTVAHALELRLMNMGQACCVLDGDNVRGGLNRDLGFSDADREENIRRVADVAHLFNQAGLLVIASFICPTGKLRDNAREIIGDAFIEVFIDCDLDECERRDPKGLYKKARSGEIKQFTGISAPYETPISPDIVVSTTNLTVDQSVDRLQNLLRQRGLIDMPNQG